MLLTSLGLLHRTLIRHSITRHKAEVLVAWLYRPLSGGKFRVGVHIYPAFLTRFRSEAAQTGMDTRHATEVPAGVLDSTSRSPRERNAVDMPGSAAAVEAW